MDKLVFNTKELAEIVNVSPGAIRHWVTQGMPQCGTSKTFKFYLGDVYIWLLVQHKNSNSDKWGPRYRRIAFYVNKFYCYTPDSIKFHKYVFKKRNELGLNGPKSYRKKAKKE